jgi:catechol 2,3-dioxygenase-like lactoylglutathione lyase family enzyme
MNTGLLQRVFGYQGDTLNLPVRDLAAALPYYTSVLGFTLLSQSDSPNKTALLSRDQVQIGLAENGGDPEQDGCAFHVNGLEQLYQEFNAGGIGKGASAFSTEQRDGKTWKVFFVVAPDGLCYWFGEQQGI